MYELIQQTKIKKSRKNYNCDACEWIIRGIGFQDLAELHPLTFNEKRELVKAKQNGYKIAKGDPYTRQYNKSEGIVYNFRTIPAIYEICCKYKIF